MGDEPAAGAGIPAGIAGSLGAGARLGGYRVERQLGQGGMAAVYLARDERLDRLVALKVLAPALAADQGFRTRFIRESRAAAAVDDPHIIPVFDAGDAGGVLYIAMRYVPGGDVGTIVRREGPLSPGRAAAVIGQVAAALDAAHAAGLVHRDVKPANMLADVRPGRADHVYLADFGLTRKTLAASAGLTGTGQFLGTLDYVAPEQIQGRPADGRTDQYGLACAAFELLAGAPPFRREDAAAVMYAHLSDPPPPVTSRRAGLPPGIDPVLARALAKAPASRYSSCQEFAEALLRALGTAPPRIHPSAPDEPAGHEPAPDYPPAQAASVSDRPVRSAPPDGDGAAAATAALRPQARPPAPPRLELSATVIDFGRLSHHATSPERRIRLGNAGGGTLNARAATEASWLRLRQEGDELVLAVDTTAEGEHEHTVTVHSDGGAATIRVRARVEPARVPGPQAPAGPRPPTAPEAPERDQPGPRPETSVPSGPPPMAPPLTATAPVAATPASGAVSRSAAGPAPPSAGEDLHPASRASHHRGLLIAGGLAIAGSVVEVAGLFPIYLNGVSLAGLYFAWPQAIIAAAVTLTAGACMLIPRTRPLIGPGLLVGTVPASVWALISLATDGLAYNGLAGGFWLQVVANLILVLSACLAAFALTSAAEVSLTRRPAPGMLPWVVALLGVTGALALAFLDHNLWAAAAVPLRESELTPSIWATVMAVLVPACAMAVLPRRFGISLLAGWIGGAFSIFLYESLLLNYARNLGISSAPNVAFGITLLALTAVAAFFARSAPASRVERAARG